MNGSRSIVLPLDGQERSALAKLAEREMRDLRDQARFMLRSELQRQGLLNPCGDEPHTSEQVVRHDPCDGAHHDQ